MGFGKDKKGVIFRQRDAITLLTLGGQTALKQNNPPAVVDSFRMIKSEGACSIRNGTLVEDDGPVELWLASDDLSVGEIAEAIAAGSGIPLNRGDVTGNEQALRPVWYLGALEFAPKGVGAKVMFEWSRTIRWTFSDETAFTLVAVNRGSSALTTGGSLDFFHTAFGVWVGA